MSYVIEAEGLRKRFGPTQALDGVDLAARRGTVLGVLGPNGAGKTTAVRILATLLRADAGRAAINGHDVARDPHRVRQQIGLTGQYASVDEDLTGAQNLEMIGRLLDLSARDARRRAAELLDWFDLTAAAGRVAKHYSGGMRRRLDLAASLVGRPSVIFLDEPTTGLTLTGHGRAGPTARRLRCGDEHQAAPLPAHRAVDRGQRHRHQQLPRLPPGSRGDGGREAGDPRLGRPSVPW